MKIVFIDLSCAEGGSWVTETVYNLDGSVRSTLAAGRWSTCSVFNKNTVQRVSQLHGWQVRRRPVGFRPRFEARRSRASQLNERWATDLCPVWVGRAVWVMLAPVIDYFSRELLGGYL